MSRSPSVTAAAAADSQVRGGSTFLFHIHWVSSLAICCYLCSLAVIYQDNHDTGGRVAEGCGSLRLGRAAAAATTLPAHHHRHRHRRSFFVLLVVLLVILRRISALDAKIPIPT